MYDRCEMQCVGECHVLIVATTDAMFVARCVHPLLFGIVLSLLKVLKLFITVLSLGLLLLPTIFALQQAIMLRAEGGANKRWSGTR